MFWDDDDHQGLDDHTSCEHRPHHDDDMLSRRPPSRELVEANNAAIKGEFENAVNMLDALPEEERESATALNIRAVCLQKMQKIDEAAAVWKKIWCGPTAPGGATSEKAKLNFERIMTNRKGLALQAANAALNGPHGTSPEDFRGLAANFEAIDVTEGATDEMKFLVKHNAGICYMQAQDWRKAADLLNEAIDLKPNDPSLAPVQHDVGEALRQLEDYEGAAAAFERCMGMYDDTALPQHKYATLKGLVEVHIRNANYEKAIADGDALLDMAKEHGLPLFEPHYWRGTAHFKEGDAKIGADDLAACVDIAKDPAADLGGIQRADLPNVIREAVNAIVTEGENALLTRNQHAEAHPFFDKALKVMDAYPDLGDDVKETREGAALNDAVCLAHEGQWDAAKTVIEDQIERTDPERGWKLLGAVYTEGLANPEKAKDCYEHATGLAGTYAPKGYAPDSAKWRDVPCSSCRRAHEPDDAPSLHNLGFACYKLDCLYGARDAFQAALKVDPNNEATQQCLLLILSLLESRERRIGAELDKLRKDADAGKEHAADRDAKLADLKKGPSDQDKAALKSLDEGLDDLDDRTKALKDKADHEGVADEAPVKEALDALDDARKVAAQKIAAAKEAAEDQTPTKEADAADAADAEAKKLRQAADEALAKAEALKDSDGPEAQAALDAAKDAAEKADAAEAKADDALAAAVEAKDAKLKKLADEANAALAEANKLADAADAAIDAAAEKKRADEAAKAERDAMAAKADAAKKAIEAAAKNAADGGAANDPEVLKALELAKDLADKFDKALDLAGQGLVSNEDAGKALEKLESQIPPLEDIVNNAVEREAKKKAERDALRKRVAAAVDAGKAAVDLADKNGCAAAPEVAAAKKKLDDLKDKADQALAAAAAGRGSNEDATAAVAALEAAVPELEEAVHSKLAADAKKKAEAEELKQKLHNAEHAAEVAAAKAAKAGIADDVADALKQADDLRKLADAKVAAFEAGDASYDDAAAAVAAAEQAANGLDAAVAEAAAAKAKREAEEEARRKAEEARKKREQEELDAMMKRGADAKNCADDAKRDALAEDPTLLEDDDVAAALKEAERLRRLAEQALKDAAAGKIGNAEALAAVEAAEAAYRAFRDKLNEARLRRQRARERKALRRALDQASKTITGAPAWAKQRNFIHEAEYPKDLVNSATKAEMEAQAKLAAAEAHPDDVAALDAAKLAVAACTDAALQVSKALDDADRAYRKRRRREADEKEAALRRRLEEEEQAARNKAKQFYDHINRRNMKAMGLDLN